MLDGRVGESTEIKKRRETRVPTFPKSAFPPHFPPFCLSQISPLPIPFFLTFPNSPPNLSASPFSDGSVTTGKKSRGMGGGCRGGCWDREVRRRSCSRMPEPEFPAMAVSTRKKGGKRSANRSIKSGDRLRMREAREVSGRENQRSRATIGCYSAVPSPEMLVKAAQLQVEGREAATGETGRC